jgi:hypothetical protein
MSAARSISVNPPLEPFQWFAAPGLPPLKSVRGVLMLFRKLYRLQTPCKQPALGSEKGVSPRWC